MPSRRLFALLLAPGLTTCSGPPPTPDAQCGEGTVYADVVALDAPIWLNRLGSNVPGGMIFALRGDVEPLDASKPLASDNIKLREDKRPRPLVLRVNVNQCLDVRFTNYLQTPPPTTKAKPPSPASMALEASLHVTGLSWRTGPQDDGSYVGANPDSQVKTAAAGTDAQITYKLYAPEEGTFLLYSHGDVVSAPAGFPNAGQSAQGLFGAVHVEPPGAEYYRSQVSEEDLRLATTGTTPDGQPLLDYDAVYKDGPRKGTPILAMTDKAGNLVHSDLTAIITGPHRGPFTGESPSFDPVAASPDRREPYREISVFYHDIGGLVTQAFPNQFPNTDFEGAALNNVLGGATEAFGINYGSAGISNEIVANRLGTGPMSNCTDCKFEEFFLSSWTVGDPAMVVDKTNTGEDGKVAGPNPDATVLYPDDPSNVYHSYLRDHVKFRVLHGAGQLHHIHHQHAHQWLYTPDEDQSHYLDSQALGPGAGYTMEMVYGGSGNKNLAVGDSIFHCHFYPHFAAGMWAMWRVHDVLETGTPLVNGVVTGRALPDGEIKAGTPIPAVVPIPGLAMAPTPAKVRIDKDGQVDLAYWAQENGDKNPGYPFFVPGIAGNRAPHPPLDLAHDGGLPRHILTPQPNVKDNLAITSTVNYQDFTKEISLLDAKQLDETGEPVEKVAMAYHAQREHPSKTPEGKDASFVTNGRPPAPGAPYADPCVEYDGGTTFTINGETHEIRERSYRGANIQVDAVINKAGWHFPQMRMLALWEDVVPTIEHTRPTQPMFIRANSGDCVTYQHTNLVPSYYEMDAFQVRTPTDILGQHIHLVKFDVTSSDGGANGWNYEDGPYGPEEVRERIAAINLAGGLITADGTRKQLAATAIPYFEQFATYAKEWLGAQVEYQRWYADPVLDNEGHDRTLRTVFTHDHFGPSTHQQAGMYAGLLVEPYHSIWRDPTTGVELSKRDDPTRIDGGPTNWEAIIERTDKPELSFREFGLVFQNFQLAYEAGYGYPQPGSASHFVNGTNTENINRSINAPDRLVAGGAIDTCSGVLANFPNQDKEAALPCPQIISGVVTGPPVWQTALGAVSVNYRSEPLPPRLLGQTGDAADPAYAWRSIPRSGEQSQTPPVPEPGNEGRTNLPPLLPASAMTNEDPYTPLLRAYAGDRVEIATLSGAQHDMHNVGIYGARWLAERHDPSSGYTDSQSMGLSEHFEFDFQVPASSAATTDMVYLTGAATQDLVYGNWGLLRAYTEKRDDLVPLPSWTGAPADLPTCPADAPVRTFAVTAREVAVTYAPGLTGMSSLAYTLDAETYKGAPVEVVASATPTPLVLRAAAGDCIQVTLTNAVGPTAYAAIQTLLSNGGFNPPAAATLYQMPQPSMRVGMHAQLLDFDHVDGAGVNVGVNTADQTAAPGGTVSYTWYAGMVRAGKHVPVEYGTINLSPADLAWQQPLGLVGTLVVEPAGSTWAIDAGNPASAWVTAGAERFREVVLVWQNDVLQADATAGSCAALPGVATNYTTAPIWMRATCSYAKTDLSAVFADTTAGAPAPVFTAKAGQPLRIRLAMPGAVSGNEIFTVAGHAWQEEPWVDDSTRLGVAPTSNWFGAQANLGAGSRQDIVIPRAGGEFALAGDYLIRTFNGPDLAAGLWGILRVESN